MFIASGRSSFRDEYLTLLWKFEIDFKEGIRLQVLQLARAETNCSNEFAGYNMALLTECETCSAYAAIT